MPAALLLDTCALIWLAGGDRLEPAATAAIEHAAQRAGVLISPISAWEIGILSRPRTSRRGSLRFLPDAKSWFEGVMAEPGFREAEFNAGIAIDASHLPGNMHADPADRLLLATARHLDVPIVTRDARILDYARAGHVQVVPC